MLLCSKSVGLGVCWHRQKNEARAATATLTKLGHAGQEKLRKWRERKGK